MVLCIHLSLCVLLRSLLDISLPSAEYGLLIINCVFQSIVTNSNLQTVLCESILLKSSGSSFQNKIPRVQGSAVLG